MNATSTQTWLKTVSVIVIVFGVVIAMAAHPALAGVIQFMIDMAFWPIDGAQDLTSPELRLLCAVSGGMMVGWGILFYLLAARLYPRDRELARTMILSSIGAWFVVDSIASIVAGAPMNVLFNIPFLLAFVWPLRHTTGGTEV